MNLNDSETERESLQKRLHTAEAKAGQFDQVTIINRPDNVTIIIKQ